VDNEGLEYDLIKRALRDVLSEVAPTEMAGKFSNGSFVLRPADSTLQDKEIPIEVFFKKVIRVRDALRVLEQKINNHPKLSDGEKSTFQGYITKSYGTLTSFNVLFANKKDHFIGQRSR